MRLVLDLLAGESYGGHYVPALAHMIHERNTEISKSNLTDGVVPLAGIAIGDGWVDPVHQIPVYPELMYNLGLVNRKQRRVVQVGDARCAHGQVCDGLL